MLENVRLSGRTGRKIDARIRVKDQEHTEAIL